MNKENKFYVYVYCNPLKPGNYTYFENGIGINFEFEPFYIGKGKDERIYNHLKEAKNLENTTHKCNTIRKIWGLFQEPIIYKIFENLEESFAYNLEKYFIKLIGRKNENMGPLCNLQDGGAGLQDSTGEIAKQISETKKENYASGKTVSFWKGKKGMIIPWNKGLTKETDIRIKEYSENMLGIKYSEERIQKQKDGIILNGSNKGEKNPMYGKSVYNVWIEKYGIDEADRRQNEANIKNSLNNSGENNAMYGKSIYDVWVEKYGVEEADERKQKWKNNLSKSRNKNA